MNMDEKTIKETSLSTRMFSFTLSLLIVFQKSVIILRGSSTPIIWNRLLMFFSSRYSSTPRRINPPMVLAKAEYVCHIDLGTSAFAFLHSSVTRSPFSNVSLIVFSSISFAKLINNFVILFNPFYRIIRYSLFQSSSSSLPHRMEVLSYEAWHDSWDKRVSSLLQGRFDTPRQ